jgi:hypothetical protein
MSDNNSPLNQPAILHHDPNNNTPVGPELTLIMTNAQAESLVPVRRDHRGLEVVCGRYSRAVRETPIGGCFVAARADRNRIRALGAKVGRRIQFEAIEGAPRFVFAVIVEPASLAPPKMESAFKLDSRERSFARKLFEDMNTTPVGGSFIVLQKEETILHKLTQHTKWRVRLEPVEGFRHLKKGVVEARGAKLRFNRLCPPPKPRWSVPLRIIAPGTAQHTIGISLSDELRSLPVGFDLLVPRVFYQSNSIATMARRIGVLVKVYPGPNSNWRVHRLRERRCSEDVLAKLRGLGEGESFVTWKSWRRRLHSFARHQGFYISTESESKGRIRVLKLTE